MKLLAILTLSVVALSTEAQVIFRNDFVIGKHSKIKNKGLTFITINLDRYPNLNMLINGRGGRSVVVDVEAMRHKKEYSYTELAERIYTPGPTYRPSIEPIPSFLLPEPPHLRKTSFSGNEIILIQPHLRSTRTP